LRMGDEERRRCAGLNATTYAAVAFNGFPPLQSYVI
jgi:hypothetical protein